jgi:hypothetical protein
MTERVVPDVIELLDSYGQRLRWIHIPDSRTVSGASGFPDFIITGPHGILYRECKPRRSSQLGRNQIAWKYMLLAAGANCGVWAQEDLDDGTAQRELEELL